MDPQHKYAGAYLGIVAVLYCIASTVRVCYRPSAVSSNV